MLTFNEVGEASRNVVQYILQHERTDFRQWLDHFDHGLTPELLAALILWLDEELTTEEEETNCKAALIVVMNKHVYAAAACLSWWGFE